MICAYPYCPQSLAKELTSVLGAEKCLCLFSSLRFEFNIALYLVVQKAYNGLIKVLSEAPTVTLANAQPTEQQTAICVLLLFYCCDI